MSLLTFGFAVACGNADSTARSEPPLGASGFVSYPPGSGGFASSTGGASTIAPMGGTPPIGAGGIIAMPSMGGGTATTTGGSSTGAGGIVDTGGTAGAPAGSGGAPVPGAGGSPTPPAPDDGDPSAPIFTTPDVACGPPPRTGLSSGNFTFENRPVIVTYPCEKHAGAPMIFFLNLHGTTPVAQHFYQHRYFAAYNYAQAYNLIVVTPSSVVEQWGNGDNGEDLPHLLNLINWVYSTFDGPGKFDIRAMWVGGHSWGAFYTTTFVCRPEVAAKVKGAVIMSSGGRNPTCANAISVISTAAEDDIGPVVDQGTVPTAHGCDASMTSMLGNNEETLWPNCDPGFVHSNYFMLGKTHTSSIDAVVVERIVTLMNQARP